MIRIEKSRGDLSHADLGINYTDFVVQHLSHADQGINYTDSVVQPAKIIHALSKRLVSLGIMGVKLRQNSDPWSEIERSSGCPMSNSGAALPFISHYGTVTYSSSQNAVVG